MVEGCKFPVHFQIICIHDLKQHQHNTDNIIKLRLDGQDLRLGGVNGLISGTTRNKNTLHSDDHCGWVSCSAQSMDLFEKDVALVIKL